MNLLHLEAFYHTARQKSFTSAAKTLLVSQSNISQAIKKLEDILGAKLLTRNKNGVSLTSLGLTLFQGASDIFGRVQSLKTELQEKQSKMEGNLSVGMSDNLANHVFPPFFKAFKKRWPGIRLQVYAGTSGSIKEELLYDRCDLGYFFTPVKKSEPFLAVEFAQIQFVIVVSKNNPWKVNDQDPYRLIHKNKIPKIGSRLIDYQGIIPAHFHMNNLGLTEMALLETNQHEVHQKLALQGLGYAVLIEPSVRNELSKGRLIRMATPEPLLSPIYRVVRQNRLLSPLGKIFDQEFRQLFK